MFWRPKNESWPGFGSQRASSDGVRGQVVSTVIAALILGALGWLGATVIPDHDGPCAVVEIPPLVGLLEDDAQTQLSELGFTVHTDRHKQAGRSGEVFATDPEPETFVPCPNERTVILKTVKSVEMPNLKGKSETEAVVLLEHYGAIAVPEYVDEPAEPGTVVWQSVLVGAAMPLTVVIRVSSFPNATDPSPPVNTPVHTG